MKNTLLTLSSIVLLSILLNSCKKEKATPIVKDTPATVATENRPFERMISRTEIVFAALGRSGSFKRESANAILSCATVDVDSTAMPRVTVINYGITGCLGSDGVTRKGKMII